MECIAALNNIIGKIEASRLKDNKFTISRKDFVMGRAELSWTSRATVIYFSLYPLLGRKDVRLTSSLLSISENTIYGWMYKLDMKKKWMPLALILNYDDVAEALHLYLSTIRDKLNLMNL